jgi:hypothetical protein
MKPPLEETPEYKRGRNGEILMHSFAIEHGCTTFDIGGTAAGRAPLLNSKFKNIIAPDALHIRNYPILAEYKTKTNAFDWRGGSRDMANHVPPCLAHGIDRRAFGDYQIANVKIPVTLWFLTINTGVLHVASLDELAEPFDSVDHKWPMVNWPISRMARVASFDRKRLWQYFRKSRLHAGLPTVSERQELLQWLRPYQLEFEGFVEHFLIAQEERWKPKL